MSSFSLLLVFGVLSSRGISSIEIVHFARQIAHLLRSQYSVNLVGEFVLQFDIIVLCVMRDELSRIECEEGDDIRLVRTVNAVCVECCSYAIEGGFEVIECSLRVAIVLECCEIEFGILVMLCVEANAMCE